MQNSPEKNILSGKETIALCMACGRPMGPNHNCDEEEESDIYNNNHGSTKGPTQADIDDYMRNNGVDPRLQENGFKEE